MRLWLPDTPPAFLSEAIKVFWLNLRDYGNGNSIILESGTIIRMHPRDHLEWIQKLCLIYRKTKAYIARSRYCLLLEEIPATGSSILAFLNKTRKLNSMRFLKLRGPIYNCYDKIIIVSAYLFIEVLSPNPLG